MSYFKSFVRCVAIVVSMVGALGLLGCATPGKIGEVAKFDIATASPDDIGKALEKDGKVVISGGILFETDSAKLAPSAADVVRRISEAMKKNPNLKISVVGHTDSTATTITTFSCRSGGLRLSPTPSSRMELRRTGLPPWGSGRRARWRRTTPRRGGPRTDAWSLS